MPRIDPLQLLKCLSVLLTPEGGILSRDEVPRLVNLMTKFSKKLVSKCVYVLILKNTETDLVDMFMAEGGWTLIQTWLQDAVQTANWDLVREILGLLLITPVDVERLKLNILPKLIKSLSRRDELDGVANLSSQLVQQWLAIVKSSSNSAPAQVQVQPAPEKVEPAPPVVVHDSNSEEMVNEQSAEGDGENNQDNTSDAISTGTFYKPSVRDGKLVIRKLAPADDAPEEVEVAETVEEVVTEQQEKPKEPEKKSEEKDRDKSKSGSSRSPKSKSSSSSSRDKDKDRRKSSSSSRSSKSKSSSSSSSRDKDRKDRDKDKDKHRSSRSSSKDGKSSSSGKDRRESKDKDKQAEKDKDKQVEKDKDKQAEKDKDTLAQIKPPPIEKLGRIPKKAGSSTPDDKAKETKENKEVKKKSFSVGIRKDSEERPKTVKVFNSKMRSTGLEEEVKPAPPRPVKKPTPSVQLPTIPPKRPSPPRDHRDPILPPDKKLKIDKVNGPERPGAIKLIPPKPKPMLQESDLFMDALTAATTKKEPKKRKRRPSVTKDSPPSPSSSPASDQPQTPTSPQNATAGAASLALKNIAPINFYQDTLSTEENAENAENEVKENGESSENNSEVTDENKEETSVSPTTPTDENNEEDAPSEAKRVRVDGGMKGVLLYSKKKGPKRSISWKAESDLVEIRYFELDETERVNVTKTFGDMAKMEMTSEREALQMSRKISGEDNMEPQVMWRLPYVIEQAEPLAVPGHKSLEKDIQFAREKSILQALYFDKRKIPDSPEEPIPENHQMSDPVLIPLEDPDSQEIDLRNTPWPEAKGSPPHVEPTPMPQHMFPTIPGPFNHPFNNIPPPQFPAVPPRFNNQNGPGPVGPGNFMPPNIMPNGNIMAPPNMVPPAEMMNQAQMNPNLFPPGPGPDGFGPAPDFPMFANQNPPNNMNMFPPNNFNNHRQGNRGGFRRGGGGGNNGSWVRMSGQGNWKRGGGGHRGRLCKNVQNHGYCRNRDKCQFVHP